MTLQILGRTAIALPLLVVSVPALAGELLAGLPAGETPVRVAANGAQVPMPDIASLDCAGLARTIAAIDASGYRGETEDLPPSHPDHGIFLYENALTATEYFECTLGQSRNADPELAFQVK
ncbi:MAG: hypothetical protein AAF908_02310 [Pseudomonadota bacterium]